MSECLPARAHVGSENVGDSPGRGNHESPVVHSAFTHLRRVSIRSGAMQFSCSTTKRLAGVGVIASTRQAHMQLATALPQKRSWSTAAGSGSSVGSGTAATTAAAATTATASAGTATAGGTTAARASAMVTTPVVTTPVVTAQAAAPVAAGPPAAPARTTGTPSAAATVPRGQGHQADHPCTDHQENHDPHLPHTPSVPPKRGTRSVRRPVRRFRRRPAPWTVLVDGPHCPSCEADALVPDVSKHS